ncbi:hypothetical protein NEUTE1DRAFT_121569 [Neurospora tetrasperma FGSC 2508]|uniref:Uncharacterized protein n=1 Tax=Neurospora tetrasperma (strain FGSC 2508 / ATCC MYA-4615 / P0657) TaxID=510951 RepID=F8MIW4_NEUT8|nr:uncharacterized protein NEUTE1DRAFT_121569 [Neurospora tetrasperma FGSC 2508]EGO59861.1 hypothetical protein NEUTE1DRAFT_121569 [Neurospora tetrasperma FGSC 2508]
MPAPHFASPDRVMRAAHRMETLVEIMREHRLEFVAILHAAHLYVRWVKAYDRQDLDPEDDDEDWAVDWEHPNAEKDVGILLALALGEMGIARRKRDEPPGLDRILEDCLRRLYVLLYDIIYWDFGGVVGLLAPATPGALLKKPKDDEWVLRELPDAADTGDSTDKPPDQSNDKPSDEATNKSTKESTDKPAKDSSNKSTDESSDESSNESSKADPKENNAPEVLDPKFYAAAKSLQHLCEQEFYDLSKEYYVHPTVKKLLEFHWNMRSRKGKKKADPRFPYAAEQRFMTVDGVSEFIDPEFLPAPPPPEPLSKLEFLDLVNERTTKPQTTTTVGPSKTAESAKPAGVANAPGPVQRPRTPLPTGTPTTAGPSKTAESPKKPAESASLSKVFRFTGVSPGSKPSQNTGFLGPTRFLATPKSHTIAESSKTAESRKPANAWQTPEYLRSLDDLWRPARVATVPRTSQPAGTSQNTPAESPKSTGLLEPAEIIPSSNNQQPGESPKTAAESSEPTGVSRAIGIPSPPEVEKPAESPRSAQLLEPAEIFSPLDISPTPRAKSRSPSLTQTPTRLGRREEVGGTPESPESKMLIDEEEAEGQLAETPSSSSANASIQAKKRSPPSVERPTQVKRRREVSAPSESPAFEKRESEEEGEVSNDDDEKDD